MSSRGERYEARINTYPDCHQFLDLGSVIEAKIWGKNERWHSAENVQFDLHFSHLSRNVKQATNMQQKRNQRRWRCLEIQGTLQKVAEKGVLAVC